MKHKPKISIKLHKKYLNKSLIASAVLMTMATPVNLVSNAYADKYDDRIKALQSEVSQDKSQAAALQSKAANLQEELAQLSIQKNTIEAQIGLNQAKYDKLQQQINNTKAEIKLKQDALGTIVANMYVNGQISPLEMLASSKNISSFLDKQTYSASMRDEIVRTITTIKQLKSDLDRQNVDVKRTLNDSKNAREALASKEGEQKTLLTQTNGQEQAYQTLAKDKQAQTEKLVNEQIAMNTQAAQNSGSQILIGGVVGGGGYPGIWANSPSDSLVDSWNLYNRECVSYVAWKIASTGRFVPNFNGRGNANQWEDYVAGYGIKSGSTPVVGSAAVLYGGAYGHVMYVEAVSADKSRITISEYNYNWSGLYSKRSISSTGLRYLYF
ncbi:MAG: CHAP domain-containing protein [Candidatus Saccharibacteria bacterium]